MKWLILCLPLVGCGPSCEDQGGVFMQDGYFYVPQIVGKITVLQQYPNYVCKKEKNNG